MNILEIEDLIKGLPDQALMQEAQQPSGRMPQYLVVSEIQRRGDMRKRFQAQQQGQDRGTIAQQILQGGVQEGPAPQMQAPMGQPQGMMPPPAPPQGIAAMAAPRPPQGPPTPPQGIPELQAAQMAAQAPVRMAEGQRVPSIVKMQNMGQVPSVSGGLITNLEAQLSGIENELTSLGPYSGSFGPFGRIGTVPPGSEEKYARIDQLENLKRDTQRRLDLAGRLSEMEPGSELPPARQAGSFRESPYLSAQRDADLRALADIESRLTIDPRQASAVVEDASRININAGSPVPGQITLDEDLLKMGAADTDPQTKVKRDLFGGAPGYDPTGASRYALGDMSGIGSVSAAQQLLQQTPAAVPEFTEEGALASIGNPLAEFQAKRIREAELPGRSYQELINMVKASRERDYSEGTAAAAALRAESEAEQQRLKEEGRSAALSDALIALGAGIAGGDLAGGLSRAGQAATAARKEFDTAARQERRYGTLEARAEERAARAARSAAEMQELGLMGRQVEADYEAEVAKINRDLEADKVLASAAERMGADRRAAEQFLVSTRAKAESLMAQLKQLDQEDRKQAELSSRAIADFLEEVVKGDLPAGLQMKSPEEQANYRRRVIRQYIPDLEAVFGRKIELEDIEDGPAGERANLDNARKLLGLRPGG